MFKIRPHAQLTNEAQKLDEHAEDVRCTDDPVACKSEVAPFPQRMLHAVTLKHRQPTSTEKG